MLALVCVLIATTSLPAASLGATPTYRATVERLSGPTALDTMSSIVSKGWTSADSVIITTNDGYWDALSASTLAGLTKVPILLTDGKSLSKQTTDQIKRLGASHAYICGGTAAVSSQVHKQVASALKGAAKVERLSGNTATGTACAVVRAAAKASPGTLSHTAFVATNDGYWDALSASPVAYALHMPVLLTNGAKVIEQQTLDAMKATGVTQVVILGGTAAVSGSVVNRISDSGFKVLCRLSGDTAIDTSQAIAAWALEQGLQSNNLAIASVDGYWDSLTGAALCGSNRAPLLLVSDANRGAINGFIAKHADDVTNAYIFGGTAAVSRSSEARLREVLGAKPLVDATPVEKYGQLHVSGVTLAGESGAPFQIRGVSTHGLAWFPQYVNSDSFRTLRSWGANTVRLACYSAEYGGWTTTDDAGRKRLLECVCAGIDAATAQGMYVIVDWHILSDGNPLTNVSAAKSFFQQVSARYAGQNNVLYEICNEPNGGTTWDQIRSYAQQVIPVIRAHSPKAVVICGTPTWSQEVDKAAARPLDDKNVLYTLHFYAGTHKDDLRNKATSALNAGLPILVSEFGVTDASGNGSEDLSSANTWISLLDRYGVGYVCWSLSNKAETSALIANSCTAVSGWTDSQLTVEGHWYKGVLQAHAGDEVLPSAPSGGGGTSGGGTSGSGKLTVTPVCVKPWSDGSASYAQYSLQVKNDGPTDVTTWSYDLVFDGPVEVSQGWNATFTVKGTTIHVVPDQNVAAIKAGQSSDSVGLIVRSSKPVSLKS